MGNRDARRLGLVQAALQGKITNGEGTAALGLSVLAFPSSRCPRHASVACVRCPAARAAARCSNTIGRIGVPVEAPGAYVLDALLDPPASDFAVSDAFLPLVHQCARVLARGTAAASLAPGDVGRGAAATGDWRVEDESGRAVPTTLAAERGATRIVTAPLGRPSVDCVFEGATLRESFAANPDPREGDLAAIDESSLMAAFPPGVARVLRADGDVARRVREARFGCELWRGVPAGRTRAARRRHADRRPRHPGAENRFRFRMLAGLGIPAQKTASAPATLG